MPSHENIYLHQLLINYMNQRSYRVPSSGICLGVASMGMQALLLGREELERFCRRLDAIIKQFSIYKFDD